MIHVLFLCLQRESACGEEDKKGDLKGDTVNAAEARRLEVSELLLFGLPTLISLGPLVEAEEDSFGVAARGFAYSSWYFVIVGVKNCSSMSMN